MSRDKLSKLIESLDPQEKRYFRLQSRLYSVKSNYLKLYDVLVKDPVASNEKLIRVINSGTNVSAEKERLYLAIMNALRNYNQADTAPDSLIRGISDLQILLRKGMYWDCIVQANHLYDKAIITNNFGYALAILGHKQTCNIRLQDIKGLKAYAGDQKKLLKLIAEAEGLKTIQSLFTSWAHETSTAINVSSKRFIAKILSNPLLKKPGALSSFYNKIMAYRLVSSCTRRLGDNRKAFKAISVALALFKERPDMIQLYLQPYIALLFTAESITIELGRFDLSLLYLEQLEQLIETKHPLLTEGFRDDWKTEIAIRKIILYDAENRYTDVLNLCNNRQPLPRFNMPANQIIIHFYSAKAHFYKTEYDQALPAIVGNLNMLNTGVRKDLLLASQLLHIMIQVMSGNAGITASFIASFARNCRKSKMMDSGIKSLIQFLNRLARVNASNVEREKLCRIFLSEFNHINPKSINVDYMLDVTGFINWVNILANSAQINKCAKHSEI